MSYGKFHGNGYKLKEGETVNAWLKAFCAQLNKATKGVTYWFREWSYGCCIEARPQNSRYQISIRTKPPRWRTDGDIAAVNVESGEIYRHHPRLNRRFKVSPDGTVNIAKLHKCVQERISRIEAHEKRQKEQRESYENRKDLLEKALEGSGIEIEYYSDDSGAALKKDRLNFSTTIGMSDVTIRVSKLFVPFERIPAFFEAWAKLEEAIKGDDDE